MRDIGGKNRIEAAQEMRIECALTPSPGKMSSIHEHLHSGLDDIYVYKIVTVYHGMNGKCYFSHDGGS